MASLCNIQRSLFITFLFPSDSNTLQSAGAWMENEEKMKKPKTYTSNVSFLHRENSRLNCFVRPIHLNRKNDFFRCPLPFVPIWSALYAPQVLRRARCVRASLARHSDGTLTEWLITTIAYSRQNRHDVMGDCGVLEFVDDFAEDWVGCDDQKIFFCFITLLRESLGVWWKFKLKVNMAVTSSIFVSA